MSLLAALKRRLREHPWSRGAYAFAADRYQRARITLIERVEGRYYTAARLDRLFSSRPDPWSYKTDPSSQQRRQLTLQALPEARYGRILEVGCAEGWMTELLAERADAVHAVDISAVALGRARQTCARFTHVTFEQIDLVERTPRGDFDAIVCTGVLVLLPAEAQARVRDGLVAALRSGGDFMLENQTEGFPGELPGSTVEAGFRAHPDLVLVHHQRVVEYDLAVFRKK